MIRTFIWCRHFCIESPLYYDFTKYEENSSTYNIFITLPCLSLKPPIFWKKGTCFNQTCTCNSYVFIRSHELSLVKNPYLAYLFFKPCDKLYLFTQEIIHWQFVCNGKYILYTLYKKQKQPLHKLLQFRVNILLLSSTCVHDPLHITVIISASTGEKTTYQMIFLLTIIVLQLDLCIYASLFSFLSCFSFSFFLSLLIDFLAIDWSLRLALWTSSQDDPDTR